MTAGSYGDFEIGSGQNECGSSLDGLSPMRLKNNSVIDLRRENKNLRTIVLIQVTTTLIEDVQLGRLYLGLWAYGIRVLYPVFK